ncbi:helix-turn-helix domain-containing protein [Chitinophagaceae bacterium MMS25-I14]
MWQLKTNTMAEHKIHQGRNVKRFREMLGLKQEWLAFELGDDWSQKKVSQLENKEEIEPKLLQEIATLLKIPVAAFENFDEEAAISFIGNTFTNNDSSAAYGHITNYTPVINPLEKWLEAMEENKKLYERLLATEREKVALLEKLLDGKP